MFPRNTTLYAELSETAHLGIHKTRKLPSVKNEYEAGDSLIFASHLKIKENYHIFEDVFLGMTGMSYIYGESPKGGICRPTR